MQETIIDLHFRENDFRELYYIHGQGNIFTSYRTRINLWFTALMIIISVVLYLLSIQSDNMAFIVPFVMCVIITLTCILQLFIKLNKHYEWKRDIETFIKRTASYKMNRIVVNDACIEIIQDKELNIEKWEAIKSVSIQENFIALSGANTNYIFPAKSMQPGEFELLKNFIQSKLKNAVLKDADLTEK